MRTNKKGEVSYSSFQELAAAWKIAPVSKVTKDKEKLKAQQNNFCKKHRCKACGEPMQYLGGNVMTCKNPKCAGIKYTKDTVDGKAIYYLTSYDLLDDVGAEIASNIL